MSHIDRQIAFARTRDGERAELLASRILVDGPRAWSGACELEPELFADEALDNWRRWGAVLPPCRRRALVAENGVVVENGVITRFFVTHSAGTVLTLDGSFGAGREFREPVAWDAVPDSPVVLGAAAVLCLTNFLLDSLLGIDGVEPWPFPEALVVEDTTVSPYPPQSRTDSAPICLASGIAPPVDETAFMLLQRGERWQRPLNALYNIRRHNLCVRHRSEMGWPESAIVIDSLVPENEPTHQECAWLATWQLRTPRGHQWGVEPIALRFAGRNLLRWAPGAAAAPEPGCVPDAIEGEVFGTAPALVLRERASALHASVVRP
jgi:hypothetical protein